MTTQISAAFEIAGWDETPFADGDPEDGGETKLTEALVTKRYTGTFGGRCGGLAGSLSLDLDA